MRRLGVIVALSAVLGMLGAALAASPALAGRGPKWTFEGPTPPPFTLPAAVCGFKVRVAFPVNKEYVKILKASDGLVVMLHTGSLKVSLTNLNTGKTITEYVNGPGKVTKHPDGSFTFTGKGHQFTPPDAKRFGLPVLGVTAGALTVSFGPSGNVTSETLHGHVLVDLCAALS